MTKNQKLLFVAVGILIIGLIALWYFFDARSALAPEPQSTGTTTPNNNGISVGNVTVDATSASGQVKAVDTATLPPAPSLTKAVSYASSVVPALRAVIEKNIVTLRADIKTNPYSLQDWTGLGLYYKQAGDYAQARDAWEYASLLSPGNVVTFNNLGDLYHYYLKDFPKAEKNFLTAIANDKKYTLSYINLSDLYKYSYQTNTTKAADTLKEGMAANPENIDLVVTLATYYKEKGDTMNARTYYTQALEKAKTAKNQTLIDQLTSELNALK